MNKELSTIVGNERGSALIIAVLVLLTMTIIGILASRTALIEQQVATSDKVHKMVWHATDAVVDGLMPELIEQNIAKRGFGSGAPPIQYGNTANLDIYTSDFFLNENCAIPSETNRDVQANGLSNTTVRVSVFGSTSFSPGNAIQLPEGYHGRGKGLAGGGAQLLYIIRGFGKGPANAESRITTGWRHLT